MKELEEKILREGTVLPGNILKVGSFLNHQIDVPFLEKIGQEMGRLFADDAVTKVVTIEASGIAFAVAAGMALKVPMVFAKKQKSGNVSGDQYRTVVHSYTHGKDYKVTLPKDYLTAEDRVLLVDDFLATGNAFIGLIDIVRQAGATLVGISAAVEKGFQKGGDQLRDQGIRVESMAIVEDMTDGVITFRPQN